MITRKLRLLGKEGVGEKDKPVLRVPSCYYPIVVGNDVISLCGYAGMFFRKHVWVIPTSIQPGSFEERKILNLYRESRSFKIEAGDSVVIRDNIWTPPEHLWDTYTREVLRKRRIPLLLSSVYLSSELGDICIAQIKGHNRLLALFREIADELGKYGDMFDLFCTRDTINIIGLGEHRPILVVSSDELVGVLSPVIVSVLDGDCLSVLSLLVGEDRNKGALDVLELSEEEKTREVDNLLGLGDEDVPV